MFHLAGVVSGHLVQVPWVTWVVISSIRHLKLLVLGYPSEVECSQVAIFEKMWTPDYFPESCPAASSLNLNFREKMENLM